MTTHRTFLLHFLVNPLADSLNSVQTKRTEIWSLSSLQRRTFLAFKRKCLLSFVNPGLGAGFVIIPRRYQLSLSSPYKQMVFCLQVQQLFP